MTILMVELKTSLTVVFRLQFFCLSLWLQVTSSYSTVMTHIGREILVTYNFILIVCMCNIPHKKVEVCVEPYNTVNR